MDVKSFQLFVLREKVNIFVSPQDFVKTLSDWVLVHL